MKTVEGFFPDGKVPASVPAKMFFEDSATMATETAQVRLEIDQLWVSPRIGTTLRVISLPNGGQFVSANALALPGGTIVVTDGLVNMAVHQDEVMAVLAHEIAHVELRHVIKAVLQQSALVIVVAAVTSDAATLSAAVAGLPLVLAHRYAGMRYLSSHPMSGECARRAREAAEQK